MPEEDDGRVTAALMRAIQQLEAAVQETEAATLRISALADRLHDWLDDPRHRLQAEGILEACTFGDVAIQRIRKVQRLIRYLHDNRMVAAGDLPPESSGPRVEGLTQAEVDRLLSARKRRP